MMLMMVILFMNVSVLAYMSQQQKLARQYPEGVPLFEPVKEMVKVKWVIGILFVIVAAFILFYILDNRYPSIKTELPPFLISFAPDYDPDLLYIGTRMDEFRGPTYITILNLSENETIEELTFSIRIARMRPDEDGLNLILSDRQSPHGDARILDLNNLQSSNGRFEYLKNYGIYNHKRNETYYTSRVGGVRILRHNENVVEETIVIEHSKQYYSVAFHPNGKSIYLLGDNFVDILDAHTYEIVGTLKLGGKLRDLAVSPDGEFLYIADALWNRIRIIPAQTME